MLTAISIRLKVPTFSSPYFPYDVNVKDAAAAAKNAPALGGQIEQAKAKEQEKTEDKNDQPEGTGLNDTAAQLAC